MAAATSIPLNERGKYYLPHVRQTYIHKIEVYETKTRFYLIGANRDRTQFRLLKIDRTDAYQLSITEDSLIYTRRQKEELLIMIEEGNRSYGGLKKTCSAYGIVGFVRFLNGYYLLLINKRRKVGEIGGHSVYAVDDTAYIHIPHPSVKASDTSDENRYRTLFFGTDLTKDYYFSYTYDLSNTLQYNMTNHHTYSSNNKYNTMFVWNHFLMEDFLKKTSENSSWMLPLMHGYFIQSKFSIYGKNISICLIARRSRFFAGTRYLKRGVNEQGNVANHVETEQIVVRYDAPMTLTPDSKLCSISHITSFVHIRGSIPLYWAQDNSVLTPRAPILVQRRDPFYSSTIVHFEHLFKRYGSPIVVVNLVKAEEKRPREMILGKEFSSAIEFLNSLLPSESKIEYITFDLHKAHKSKHENMIERMEAIANEGIKMTGFFHYGKQLYSNALREQKSQDYISDIGREQRGVLRTNCIDSLDRTNAAQFFIGKCALGYQLYVMGVNDVPFVGFDSEIVDVLVDMYEGMGNQIALQYAGSELVNTIKTYRSGNLVTQSRDLFTTVKRYYSNSFTDAEKQHSMNLFLGNFIPYQEKCSLWELESDYHLHNKGTGKPEHVLLSNTKWWEVPLNDFDESSKLKTDSEILAERQSLFFEEFYKPRKITEFDRVFSLSFNNPHVPVKSHQTASVNNGQSPTYLQNLKSRRPPRISSDIGKKLIKKHRSDFTRVPSEVLLNEPDLKFFETYTDLEQFTQPKRKSQMQDKLKSYQKSIDVENNFRVSDVAAASYANYADPSTYSLSFLFSNSVGQSDTSMYRDYANLR
eukprot:TRINITY_DN6706_c0_g1_i1.p1 TRINITY_DN6706_c0_g1~~TRINITY_DN6706_c0_g1_i1.p1  ORF type:complete len:811 (-),score=116.42 TRINITY_DN6706_c0_g1_i1:131-2563(-)